MQTPRELRHALYQELYFAERARHEHIRGGIAVPVSAAAFSVYAFSAIATGFEIGKWQHPATIVVVALSLAAFAALVAGTICLIRVEWRLMYFEPPDLEELTHAEADLRRAAARPGGEVDAEAVDRNLRDLLTGTYFVAYRQAFLGNAVSARYRGLAVRFLMLTLLLVFAAYMALPFHKAA